MDFAGVMVRTPRSSSTSTALNTLAILAPPFSSLAGTSAGLSTRCPKKQLKLAGADLVSHWLQLIRSFIWMTKVPLRSALHGPLRRGATAATKVSGRGPPRRAPARLSGNGAPRKGTSPAHMFGQSSSTSPAGHSRRLTPHFTSDARVTLGLRLCL